MKINNIDNTNFTHKIIFDIGASNPKGSLKVKVIKDNGEDVFEKSGLYVNNTSDGFKSNQEFIDKIKKVVKETHDEAKKVLSQDKTVSADEKKLSGIGIFVAGTTIGDTIAFTPNLKDKEGNSLENIDFSQYQDELKTKSHKATGIDVNQEAFDLVVTKDLGGAGLGLAKILAQRNELKEGDYAIAVMTGGGYGDVELKVRNGMVEIETNECSSNLAYDKVNQKMEKLGRLGVTVKSHIGRYMKKLGMNEYASDVVRAGDARIVTNNTMKVPYYEKEILNTLNAEERFGIISFDDTENTWGIKTQSPALREKMRLARVDAVNDYAETMAQFAINKINENVNKFYFVGPLAQGLNKHIQDNTDDYNANSLPQLVEEKINELIKEIDLPSTQKLKELYNFEIICDPTINVKNNTCAGDVLMNKQLTFTPNRGGWINIPLVALENL